MARQKKNKGTRPSVRVRDLKPKKNPKGGAFDSFAKFGDITGEADANPTVSSSLNFTTSALKK